LPEHVPNPSERQLRRRVSEDASLERWRDLYDRHHFRALAELRLERLLAKGPTPRVLDIGVGWGAVYLPFASRLELWGIDFSFESLVLARRIYEQEAVPLPELVCASLNAIPLRGIRFDLVQSVQVYQHIRERPEVVHSFAFVIEELLAPGGSFAVDNLSYSAARATAMLRRLLRRDGAAEKELETGDYFLRYQSPRELATLAREASPRARWRVSFSESLFHPALGLMPRSRAAARLDAAVSRTPLGRLLGRQVRLTVAAGG
jgi:2-polyprenyl-3-methyl-5-hydroxy-6-metoxy-1,4-benzoquinol methylase